MEFEVIFTGNLRAGFERRQAIKRLADKFLLPVKQIAFLLTKNDVVIRRFAERKSGESLVSKLWDCGWTAELKRGQETVFRPADVSPHTPVKSGKLPSRDKAFSLDLPATWSELHGLNEQALLQAGNKSRNEFLIVVGQEVSSLAHGHSLAKYCAAQLRQCASRLANGAVCNPAVMLRGAKITAYSGEVVAEIESIPVRYFIVCLQHGSQIYTLFFWCEKNDFSSLLPVFNDVVASFTMDHSEEELKSAGHALSPA